MSIAPWPRPPISTGISKPTSPAPLGGASGPGEGDITEPIVQTIRVRLWGLLSNLGTAIVASSVVAAVEGTISRLVTLAVLASLGHAEEFKLHLRATRNTGATAAEVSEMLLHISVYAGVPAANTAMRLAKEVLAEPA